MRPDIFVRSHAEIELTCREEGVAGDGLNLQKPSEKCEGAMNIPD